MTSVHLNGQVPTCPCGAFSAAKKYRLNTTNPDLWRSQRRLSRGLPPSLSFTNPEYKRQIDLLAEYDKINTQEEVLLICTTVGAAISVVNKLDSDLELPQTGIPHGNESGPRRH